MSLPPFDEKGDLPPGVYPVTLSEALTNFGRGSNQRRVVANRLHRIFQLAKATGCLSRFIVYGSFVTNKAEPNDVDVFLLMEDRFDAGSTTGEIAWVFQHMDADRHLGASVFWSSRSGALGGKQTMIEKWMIRRDGGYRGILEIVEEGT